MVIPNRRVVDIPKIIYLRNTRILATELFIAAVRDDKRLVIDRVMHAIFAARKAQMRH